MCQEMYGKGHWKHLKYLWVNDHRLHEAPKDLRALIDLSYQLMPQIATVCLHSPLQALRGQSIVEMINPLRVHPKRLLDLKRKIGTPLMQSPYWIKKEALSLLALSGYLVATDSDKANYYLSQQKNWMTILGTQSYSKTIKHSYYE